METTTEWSAVPASVPWEELLADYNLIVDRLWGLVLLTTLCGPAVMGWWHNNRSTKQSVSLSRLTPAVVSPLLRGQHSTCSAVTTRLHSVQVRVCSLRFTRPKSRRLTVQRSELGQART